MEIRESWRDRKYNLKYWEPPKDNPEWSKDSCEICKKEISKTENYESYGDEKNLHWICKSCFKEYEEDLK